MARLEGTTFGIIGALAAFPRRLAAREFAARGGTLRRGITRRTGVAVFGRTLIERAPEADIERRVEAAKAAGVRITSENGLLRQLGLKAKPEGLALPRQSLLLQSGLAPHALDLLTLFDAFEADCEPYSFRDVILARSYAGLLQGGSHWSAIARSVHRTGEVASLTAVRLHAEADGAIRVRNREGLAEIDGQALLPLAAAEEAEADAYFEAAEAAEADEEHLRAARLYQRCLALDPGDSIAAFNCANALVAGGEPEEAMSLFVRAIKLDPGLVEAWFNYGSLLNQMGRLDAAREHLGKAIAIDPAYADPVYNLAALEYDAGRFPEARFWWAQYLTLDRDSEWGKRAARGVQYIDLLLAQQHGRPAG